MQIKFEVVRSSWTKLSHTAVVKGVSVPAAVDALEVELVSDHGTSFQVRFLTPSEQTEAKETFAVGKTLVWTV